jgi:predicted dehydrogenase
MKTNRRQFLSNSVGTAASLTILPSVKTAFSYQANERLQLAVFGNMYNAAHFLTAAHIYNADIVALCNPDQRVIPRIIDLWKTQSTKLSQENKPESQRAAERYKALAERKGVTIHSDVRRMWNETEAQIDALIVSDYDHFHGVTCGQAMRLGKPVCSE